MSWRILKSSGATLTEKLIAASNLNDEQVQDLSDSSSELRTSKCEAVLRAADRIRRAQANHEHVFVAGDYDADGITSTAIMKDVLDRLGIQNGYYIPDRFKEGYGLSVKTVNAALQKGYTLFITVDNGVKCRDAIDAVHAAGKEIIVTDHHTIEEAVPADLLVHPDVMEEEFRFLSGAGVALEISRALLGEVPLHTALAAVALIGDVMPVWRENRRIIRNGLSVIREGKVPALWGMLRQPEQADETAIAFQVVPKLNSPGRMNDRSNVNTLVPVLLCRDKRAIESYLASLNEINEARKKLSEETVRIAEQKAEDVLFPVICDDGFHEGVVGPAAGNLSRKWHKPVLILAKNGTLYKGSGRGIPGMNLYEFFSDFAELEAFGGHAQAVGLSVAEEHIEGFIAHVEEKMKKLETVFEEPGEPAVLVQPEDLTIRSVEALESLKPYPKELITRIALEHPVLLRKDSYPRVTKYRFESPWGGYEGVQFGAGNASGKEAIPWLIGVPSLNRFRNNVSVQVMIDAFDTED